MKFKFYKKRQSQIKVSLTFWACGVFLEFCPSLSSRLLGAWAGEGLTQEVRSAQPTVLRGRRPGWKVRELESKAKQTRRL